MALTNLASTLEFMVVFGVRLAASFHWRSPLGLWLSRRHHVGWTALYLLTCAPELILRSYTLWVFMYGQEIVTGDHPDLPDRSSL